MVQEEWRFYFFVGLNWLLVGRGRGNEQIFGWWGESPPSSQQGKPYVLYICIYKTTLLTGFYLQWKSSMCITYMYQSGHLTSDHFVCRRYIWCIFSIVCSVFIIKYIYHVMFNQVQHSGHEGINLPPQKHHPLFLAKPPPLNQQTVQAPFFGNSPYILVFHPRPLKVRSFSEPQKY